MCTLYKSVYEHVVHKDNRHSSRFSSVHMVIILADNIVTYALIKLYTWIVNMYVCVQQHTTHIQRLLIKLV